jgi:hypothetical protein
VGFVRTDASEERVAANAFLRSRIFSTKKTEKTCSHENSVVLRPTWLYIPEGGILHSHRCENRKSYILELVVVKALWYKQEGRGFDTPLGDFF